MRTLSAPTLDSEVIYRRISSGRREGTRGRLHESLSLVLTAYAEYSGQAGEICSLPPADISPATAQDLKSNYDYLSKSARDVSATIMVNNRGGRCPLCGRGQATTLDHYLPKSKYPEFSVLPLNLVPACDVCNKAKASLFVDAGGPLFLHAYLDEIPTDDQFLLAAVEVHGGTIIPRFWVEPPPSIDEQLGARIVSHFERLKLAWYYREEGINEIDERRARIEGMLDEGAASKVEMWLRGDADSVAADKGVNNWRYALLDAMACSEDVCNGQFRQQGGGSFTTGP